MPGRLRTASSPSRTWMFSAEYSPDAVVPCDCPCVTASVICAPFLRKAGKEIDSSPSEWRIEHRDRKPSRECRRDGRHHGLAPVSGAPRLALPPEESASVLRSAALRVDRGVRLSSGTQSF